MPTRYQHRNALERERDIADAVTKSLFAERHIIDTTAVVILKERELAPAATASPHALVMEHMVANLPHPVAWRQRRVWLAAAIILGVLGSIIGSSLLPPAPARVFTVSPTYAGNLTHTVSATGTISAHVVSLHFATGGQIATIDAQVGQRVAAGQILAQLNPTALQNAVTTQQAAITMAQTSYRAALLALQSMRASQQSSDAVAQDAFVAVASGIPAPDAVKLQLARDQLKLAIIQAQNQVNIAQTQVVVAQSQSALAQTQLVAAQHALTHADLRAPITGQIATVSSSIGANITSADAIITIADLSTTQITAAVNEADIGTVNVGWPVAFTLAAFPQDTFYGTVTGISLFGETTHGIVSYPVTIAIPANSPNARLFPGMTANITLTTQEAIAAILIPNAALTYARTAASAHLIAHTDVQNALIAAQHLRASQHNLTVGTASIVLQYRQGKLTASPVVIGISDGTNTVMLAGLSGDQQVVIGDNQAATTASNGTSSR